MYIYILFMMCVDIYNYNMLRICKPRPEQEGAHQCTSAAQEALGSTTWWSWSYHLSPPTVSLELWSWLDAVMSSWTCKVPIC